MRKSLELGNIAEQLLIQKLEEFNIQAFKNEDKSKRSYFDIFADIGGLNTTFEVKYDLMAAKTGNIAIEFFNSKSKKPSGIGITEADYWVHVLKIDNVNTIFICTVAELKEFIKSTKPKRIVYGGGDNNADILLFEIDRMICFKEFDDEFKRIITKK